MDAGQSPLVIVPAENAEEGALIPGAEAVSAAWRRFLPHSALRAVADLPPAPQTRAAPRWRNRLKFPRITSDVADQSTGRFALEIAAAGGHHMLLTGPPGSGKTMLGGAACRASSPTLDKRCRDGGDRNRALLPRGEHLSELVTRQPPFEPPHHSASAPAILGGGSSIPRPGCVV